MIEPSNTPFTKPTESTIWLASFDIGKKNFAFCIEEVDIKMLESIQNIPSYDRYSADYTMTPEMKKIMDTVFRSGKILIYKNTDISSVKNNAKSKSYFDYEYCHNMTDLLNSYTRYWDMCSGFIIEEQMGFRKRYNSMALKLGQHCFSYFAVCYGRFKPITVFPSYHKTTILGAPRTKVLTKTGKVKWKTLGDTQRKKWSIEIAKNILTLRNDVDTLSMYNHTRKKGVRKPKMDDVSDTLLQLQAFKYMIFVDNIDM